MALQLRPLLSQLTIKTKKLQYVNLGFDAGDYAWSQNPFIDAVEKQYNAGKPVRIIVLKARQLGISTVAEGAIFWWLFIHKGTNGLVMTHENKQSAELFEMTKLYWETWPYRHYYSLKYSTKQTLHWEETRSRLSIGTAKNVQSGRGSTFHAVHMSEAAFYPDPEAMFLGLNQTIPEEHGSFVCIESTANGMGNWFYDMWQSAEEGENDYLPLFFPWFKHPEYRMMTTLTVKSELTADERELLRLGATFENIAWRRRAIITKAGGDLAMFMQEYPSTPEEAFITTGRPIFSHLHLKRCFKRDNGTTGRLVNMPNGRVRFVRDPSGELTVFRVPRTGDTRWDRYFVAGDPSETVAGDPACIQVINRQTLEQVAVWHGQCTPVHFAHRMMEIGKFYNEAMLCPEVEGGGQATMGAILQANYPNIWMDKRPDRIQQSFNVFGWSTNYQRKQWAIGFLQSVIVDLSLILHDIKTYNQLRNYVEDDKGYWGNNATAEHDDAVMALAIAVIASDQEGPFTADSEREHSPIVDIYNQEFDIA